MFTSNRWREIFAGLTTRKLVCFLCINECNYIKSAGHHFRPDFYDSIRVVVARLWDQFPMLFFFFTVNKFSILHSSILLHPRLTYKSVKYLPADIGLENLTMKLRIVDLLPSKFFAIIIWSNVGRDEIDVVV